MPRLPAGVDGPRRTRAHRRPTCREEVALAALRSVRRRSRAHRGARGFAPTVGVDGPRVRSPPSPPPVMSLAGRTNRPSRHRHACSNCSESRLKGLRATAAKAAYRNSSQSPPSPPPAMSLAGRTSLPSRRRYTCSNCSESRIVGLLATAAKTAIRHVWRSPPSKSPAMPMNVWRSFAPERPQSHLSRSERRRVGPTPTSIADSALALEHYLRVISSRNLIFKSPTMRGPC